MRSVCSDDILFVVSGLHSSKVALFVIAGYPAPTLIGRVERCGRFLKVSILTISVCFGRVARIILPFCYHVEGNFSL